MLGLWCIGIESSFLLLSLPIIRMTLLLYIVHRLLLSLLGLFYYFNIIVLDVLEILVELHYHQLVHFLASALLDLSQTT